MLSHWRMPLQSFPSRQNCSQRPRLANGGAKSQFPVVYRYRLLIYLSFPVHFEPPLIANRCYGSVVCSSTNFANFVRMVAISTRASLFFSFVAVYSLFFRICYRFPKVIFFTLKTKNFNFSLRCELELSSCRCRFSLVATTTQTLSDLRSMEIPLKNHSLRRSIDRNNLRPSFLFFYLFTFLLCSSQR